MKQLDSAKFVANHWTLLRSQLITRLRLLVHGTSQECVYAVN
jgi:hypothetical protein